jgi:GDSL-like lipase/acylhydrolase family protein
VNARSTPPPGRGRLPFDALASVTGVTGRAGADSPLSRPRIALRWASRLALPALLALVTAELALQLAARSSSDREAASGGDRPHRILCAGDSHTYGAGVPDADSNPAQLQALRDARAPHQFGVVNVGVPGMTTTQVLNRLPEYVSRFRPETVIVWAGVNESWNTSEIRRPHGSWMAYLQGLLSASRVYRFIQVWIC